MITVLFVAACIPTKARYRGLAKNAYRLFVACALARERWMLAIPWHSLYPGIELRTRSTGTVLIRDA
jgi:hypothetical protein